MSDEDAQALLSRIYALYLQPRGGGVVCTEGESWLDWELETHLFEVRLFSRAFPELAVSTALHFLEDADADPQSLQFAQYLVGRHHQKAEARLEAAIVDLADDPRQPVHSWAIALMGWSGRRSRYRYHLWSHAAKGRAEAFRALAQDDFDDTVAFLRDLQRDDRFPLQCAEALDRIAVLRSPDRDRRLESMLRSPESLDYYWALTAAWERCRPMLLRLFTEEMDKCRKEYEPALLRDEAPVDPDSPYERPFSRRILWSTYLPEVGRDMDRILIQLADLGGDLAPIERQRLENFGFLGDPEECLLSFMRRRQQYW